jgi:uncharacterized protein (UPF0335 family)
MARRLNQETETEIDSEDVQPKKRGRPRKLEVVPSNVTDETIEEFASKALRAHEELEEKKKEMQAANGAYRAVLKEAKGSGVSSDSITWFIKTKKRETEDVESELRNRARIARIMGLPIGSQLDMFEAA